MDAARLNELATRALRIAGAPSWESPETPGAREGLVFLTGEGDGGDPAWGLVTEDAESDFVPLDPAMAASLIREHLRCWLLARAWQVQARVCGGRPEWRLADCLAVMDGGGDRLADDYPAGDDELSVLSASVVAVVRHGVPAGRAVAP